MTGKRTALIAAAVAGTVGVGYAAFAQQGPLGDFGPRWTEVRGGGERDGHGGWGHGRGMDMLCSDGRDQRIGMVLAVVDSFVTFTPEQETAWTALTEAVFNASARIGESCTTLAGQGEARTVPDRLERLEVMMATGLDVVRELRPEIEAFHATLSPEQQLMLEAMMNHGQRH